MDWCNGAKNLPNKLSMYCGATGDVKTNGLAGGMHTVKIEHKGTMATL
ncbi:hypothetical protein SPSYN_01045 [Sporotomaculum syntrophicum]|uniref:Uncharacterized protein n=1 Tax=Sporotomaculum syntrophicum TaxID=182264 RepID=A0A9D2WP82_9FIRM|nr:hypothetical protein SPSYN_01045 [Sporotomaculum syntrophicum]